MGHRISVQGLYILMTLLTEKPDLHKDLLIARICKMNKAVTDLNTFCQYYFSQTAKHFTVPNTRQIIQALQYIATFQKSYRLRQL